jgi:hypothetical protein
MLKIQSKNHYSLSVAFGTPAPPCLKRKNNRPVKKGSLWLGNVKDVIVFHPNRQNFRNNYLQPANIANYIPAMKKS